MKSLVRNIGYTLVISIFAVVSMQAKTIKTKKLQCVINNAPMASLPVSQYALNANDGSGLVHSPFETRPFGSYYEIQAFLYPANTICKEQASYLFDKNGNPLTVENSIGYWWCDAFLIETLDFSNLNALLGKQWDIALWTFIFNKNCNDSLNRLYSEGSTLVGINSLGQTSFVGEGAVTGGSGCNKNPDANVLSVELFFDQSGLVFLLEWTFDKEISYKI